MYPFKVYDKQGKLKDGIVAAFLQTFQLTKEVYENKLLPNVKGDFTIQSNPELERALSSKPSVLVICSFQVRDTCRVAVCKLKEVRNERTTKP